MAQFIRTMAICMLTLGFIAAAAFAGTTTYGIVDKARGYSADFAYPVGATTVTIPATDFSMINRVIISSKDPWRPGWIILYDGPPQAVLQVISVGAPLMLELLWSGSLVDGHGLISWGSSPAAVPPTAGGSSKSLSCIRNENVQKGCCCFKGEHTYAFSTQFVGSVKATFDTGRGLGCRSTVKFEAETDQGWQTLQTVPAVSSTGNNQIAPITVEVPVGQTIKGFRISDGCVCCIDGSEIVLQSFGGVPPPALPGGGMALGRVWDESENDWNGVWTRRGVSNVFDAIWTKAGFPNVTATLTITITGSKISIQRRQANLGGDVDYEGTLGTDGRTVTGTGRVLQTGFGFSWQATIRK